MGSSEWHFWKFPFPIGILFISRGEIWLKLNPAGSDWIPVAVKCPFWTIPTPTDHSGPFRPQPRNLKSQISKISKSQKSQKSQNLKNLKNPQKSPGGPSVALPGKCGCWKSDEGFKKIPRRGGGYNGAKNKRINHFAPRTLVQGFNFLVSRIPWIYVPDLRTLLEAGHLGHSSVGKSFQNAHPCPPKLSNRSLHSENTP